MEEISRLGNDDSSYYDGDSRSKPHIHTLTEHNTNS
jgi:hypothetical protein